MARKDILMSAEYPQQFEFSGGDFLVGDSDTMHVEDLIRMDKGQLRQNPLIGVGIGKLLNGPINTKKVEADIINNLKLDGYTTGQVDVVQVADGFQVYIDGALILNA